MLFHIEQIRQKHWSQQMIGRAVGKLFCLKLLPQFLSYLIETSCTWCLYSVDMHAISYGGTAKRFQCLPLFSKFLFINIKNVHVSNSFIFFKWSKWYIFWFRVLNCFLWHSHRSGDILVTVSGYNSRYFWICLKRGKEVTMSLSQIANVHEMHCVKLEQ